jgi:hypothetical protein
VLRPSLTGGHHALVLWLDILCMIRITIFSLEWACILCWQPDGFDSKRWANRHIRYEVSTHESLLYFNV